MQMHLLRFLLHRKLAAAVFEIIFMRWLNGVVHILAATLKFLLVQI